MQFGNSVGNFGSSAFRRPFGDDLAAGMSKLVAHLPHSMQIVHTWSEKGVYPTEFVTETHLSTKPRSNLYVDQPLLYVVDALLAVWDPPDHQIEAASGEEVLVGGVVLPLPAKVPRPANIEQPSDDIRSHPLADPAAGFRGATWRGVPT